MRALGLDELLRERAAAGRAGARHLPRHAAAVRRPRPSTGGAEGLGLLRGRGRARSTRRLKVPHIGWNPVTLASAQSPLTEGLARRRAPSTTCTPSPAARRRGRRARHRRVRRARSSASSSAATSTASSSTPRSPRRDGLRAAARTSSRCAPVRRDPLPGDRHPRRQGRAAASRATTSDETVYDDDPLEAARSWVEAGARFLHVVDLDGARAGEPRQPRAPARGSRRAGVPVQFGGGLRSLAAVREALRRRRRARGRSAPPRFTRRRLPRRGRSRLRRRASLVARRRPRRARLGRRLDRRRPQMPAEDAIRRLQRRAACARSSTRTSTATGCSRGPTSTRSRRVAEAVRGRFLYSGGIGSLDDLRALRELRQVNLAGVIVGQGALRGALHGRARARRVLEGALMLPARA